MFWKMARIFVYVFNEHFIESIDKLTTDFRFDENIFILLVDEKKIQHIHR